MHLNVQACAVCRTDLHIVDGELADPKLPLVLGHQIVGLVSEVGEGASRFSVGERVGVPWLGWTDGTCRFCRSGRENLCDRAKFTGFQIDGGFAEETVADALAKCPEVLELHHVAGNDCYLLKVRARDAEHVGQLLRHRFGRIWNRIEQRRVTARAGLVKLNTYYMSLFAKFLAKLKATPDGDGTLLDHSMILYGSGMSESDQHSRINIPTLLAGGLCGSVEGNRHIQEKKETPFSNLLLSIANKYDCDMDTTDRCTASPTPPRARLFSLGGGETRGPPARRRATRPPQSCRVRRACRASSTESPPGPTPMRAPKAGTTGPRPSASRRACGKSWSE